MEGLRPKIPESARRRIGIGDTLRARRDELDLSLAVVSDKTKIRRGLLDAIEREDYPLLPAPIFTRGFLRSYCQCLDMDPDPIVLAYDRAFRADEDEDAEPRRFGVGARPDPWSRMKSSVLRLLS
ncbi:MAG: helix-turn-helix domain-containing protein [Deltaproteobacteria bacterium]|nr:helix-turn-helix domain-containing protein [Deltaproteobacteria bacterium]